MSIKHISSNLMVADPLTKGFSPKIFSEHVEIMGIGGYHYWYCVKVLYSLCNWHFELI